MTTNDNDLTRVSTNRHTKPPWKPLASAIESLRNAPMRRPRGGFNDRTAKAYCLTFELSWMAMRRALSRSQSLSTFSIDAIFSFAEIFGMISCRRRWDVYRRIRDALSQSPNADSLAMLSAHLPQFLADAEDLLEKLKAESSSG